MKKWIKNCLFLSLILGLMVLFAAPRVAQAAAGKMAVINMQKVLRNCEAGKKAMESLNKKFDTLQAKLKRKQEQLKAFKADLEKKAPLLSEEARLEKEREYKRMLREFKGQSDDAQFEMRQLETKVMEPILKDLESVVNKIGQEKGYTIILEKNMPGLYYSSPAIDITEDVIKEYDKRR